MKYEDIQSVFQCASFLLMYPSAEWKQNLPECKKVITEINHKQISDRLQDYIDFLETMSLDEIIENYVYTFDFGKKTNLYVTYMKHGEQRERGPELLQLKNLYASAGFKVTDKELPDYLPLMLEFAGNAAEADIRPVFEKHRGAIEEIREQLIQNQSYYAILFDAILMAIEELNIPVEEGSVV